MSKIYSVMHLQSLVADCEGCISFEKCLTAVNCMIIITGNSQCNVC